MKVKKENSQLRKHLMLIGRFISEAGRLKSSGELVMGVAGIS
jgi:hypothetical protein